MGKINTKTIVELQWGHVFSGVEIVAFQLTRITKAFVTFSRAGKNIWFERYERTAGGYGTRCFYVTYHDVNHNVCGEGTFALARASGPVSSQITMAPWLDG